MKRMIQLIITMTTGFIILFSIPVFAGEVNLPRNFEAGTPAVASHVNENFDAVKSAVDDNNSRIDAKQNRVTGDCPDGSSIRSINEDGSVVCELDNSGSGDITAVIAGNGLTGGGTSDDVTLSIGTGAVGANEIATGGVGSAEILDGTITNVDISNSAAISASKINDGSGSGLDADYLDGVNGSSYVRDTGDTMTGNLTVPYVLYSTNHIHYLSIPSNAFISEYSNHDAYNGGGCVYAYVSVDSGGAMNATVNLPHGAVVTSFRGYFYNTNSTAMSLSLIRNILDGCGVDPMASVTSQTTVGYHNVVDTTISNATIDNESNAYHVRAYSANWGTGAGRGIKGAVITYYIIEAP